MKSFANKVVIVTGSSMGIGKEVARQFAKIQARVVLNARNADKLNLVEAEFRQFGYEVISVQADVSKSEDCQKLIATTITQYGRVDVLIHNAGISMRGNARELSPLVVNTVFQTNTISAFLLTQIAIPHLLKTNGSIVFISSLAALKGLPGLSAYSASKMALTALADSLRVEHAADHIHIGLIYVGYTEVEPGKTTMGADGNLIPLEKRTGNLQHSIQKVANDIVAHTIKRRRISYVGITGYLYSFLVRWFPSITEALIKRQHSKITGAYK
jgi:NAD(P)-dependent dehydrogenase (short-subunit alcohol dehydrogenase family)